MRTTFDALIIGAGPAGSTAAILLALAGWSVALVEKQRFPRRKVCGECIAPSALPLFAALGIEQDLTLRAGPHLRRLALMRGSDRVVSDFPVAPDSDYYWGRAVGRETLDTLLADQAHKVGVQLLQPCAVLGLLGGPGAWRCDIRDLNTSATQTLRARVAIAAHGSWEALPSVPPQPRRPRRPSDLLAFKANFTGASLEEGLLPVLLFDGGYGGMVVAEGGVTTMAGCLRRDKLDVLRRENPGASAGECLEAMLRGQCSGVGETLNTASRQGAWIGAGPINPGIRLSSGDGLLRVGNAAGEAHPIIGEGISMAVQSAWLLCVQLLSVDTSPDRETVGEAWQRLVARRYAREWRLHFVPRIRLASAFAHASMHARSSALLLALAKRWPAFLPLGSRWAGKIRCAIDPAEVARLAQQRSDYEAL
ncbi:tryptophan halogenase [Caballeronia arationis]|uniref:NAD(P)/FAD-dependent oxidoreductase n=1 Tax=Caballeronia arationis TaxID=1777142 RepID=UPI00074BE679|nr:FAD-dependent monooxygenase [Caballeronia arationis]SAL01392.1 tryptophan halogenase [Caballeronia arationis]